MYLSLHRALILVALPTFILGDCVDDDVKSLQSSVTSLEAKLNDYIQQRETNDNYNVAFSYALERSETPRTGNKVIFSKKIFSIGEGYDPETGVFHCPKDGMYIFTMMVVSEDKVKMELKVNGKARAIIYAKDPQKQYDQGSGTVVASLKTGDKVVVSLQNNSKDSVLGHKSRFSVFSGLLVKLT